ncbi:MAG: neutral/alkaline non-lysosomal ceramidase N-terminal domain-containing protein [Thermomicrobiales bacterium]
MTDGLEEAALRGLYAGVASVAITPPVGSDLSGFIARVEPMAGVHDDLFARALVWAEDAAMTNAAALVTLDVIDVEARAVAIIRERIAALIRLTGERVGVVCTHTHGGPATLPRSWLGRCDKKYLDRLCQAATDAVAAAAGALQPVVVRWARGAEPTVGKNRRVPGGVIDADVPVLRFQRHDGTVAALLVSYACHPVTLGPTNTLATADYAGSVRRTLEAAYPGATALFATGCCGQINTGHTLRDGERGRDPRWRTFGEAERIGRAIAGAAMQAAEQAARVDASLPVMPAAISPVRMGVAHRIVRLPLLPAVSSNDLRGLVERWHEERRSLAEGERHPGAIERLQVFLAWAEALQAGRLPAVVEAEVMVIALGDVALVLLPGELFVEFGLAIKERAAPRPVVTLAYANGTPGYIPHRTAYPDGGYEVDEAYRYYGYPACFAPEAGEAVVEAAIELLDATAILPLR